MDVNQSLQSWKQSLGSQIRDARKKAGLSQGDLAVAIGKSRQIIGRYEAGNDAPSVEILGNIALKLSMDFINVNGYRFSVKPSAVGAPPDPQRQLQLDFDKEHTYVGATIKITPAKASLMIVAIVPAV